MNTGLMTKKETGVTPRHSIFNSFRNEMNKLFDDFTFGRGFEFPHWPDLSGWTETPTKEIKLDMKDAGTELVLTAEVPGVELGDMTLAITPHYLSLSGEKKAEKSEHEKEFYRMERSYGYFRRVVPLPCEVDKDRVDAVYKDGVLRITLPKTKEAITNEKKVNIKAG